MLFCLTNNIKAQVFNNLNPSVETFEIDSLYDGEIEFDSTEINNITSTAFDTAGIVPCHALYKLWNNNLINPHGCDFTTKPDTTYIDCKGYVSPIINKLNSDFGFRRWKFHYGVDIDIEVGDTIRSAFDGMVRMATRGRRFGYYVVIRHYNGLETVYGHLKKNLVVPNQIVKAGEVIALGGNTGRSTGPHLHIEFRYLGQPINPHHVVNYNSPTQPILNENLALTKANWDYVLEIRKIRYHIVRRGDTIYRISRKYGIAMNQILKLNKISKRKLLRIGQRVRYT